MRKIGVKDESRVWVSSTGRMPSAMVGRDEREAGLGESRSLVLDNLSLGCLLVSKWRCWKVAGYKILVFSGEGWTRGLDLGVITIRVQFKASRQLKSPRE